MQIQLNQNDITIAIKEYIHNMGISNSSAEVEFETTRGTNKEVLANIILSPNVVKESGTTSEEKGKPNPNISKRKEDNNTDTLDGEQLELFKVKSA